MTLPVNDLKYHEFTGLEAKDQRINNFIVAWFNKQGLWYQDYETRALDTKFCMLSNYEARILASSKYELLCFLPVLLNLYKHTYPNSIVEDIRAQFIKNIWDRNAINNAYSTHVLFTEDFQKLVYCLMKFFASIEDTETERDYTEITPDKLAKAQSLESSAVALWGEREIMYSRASYYPLVERYQLSFYGFDEGKLDYLGHSLRTTKTFFAIENATLATYVISYPLADSSIPIYRLVISFPEDKYDEAAEIIESAVSYYRAGIPDKWWQQAIAHCLDTEGDRPMTTSKYTKEILAKVDDRPRIYLHPGHVLAVKSESKASKGILSIVLDNGLTVQSNYNSKDDLIDAECELMNALQDSTHVDFITSFKLEE